MATDLVNVHDCARFHSENQNLKKRVHQLRVDKAALEQELAGFRERQRINDILDGHVRKRTSMTQTDPCELDFNRNPRKKSSESVTVDKLISMQQQARALYEKELKRSVDHVQMITAQNGKILELQKQLTGSERETKQLLAERQRMRKQLHAVSDARLQQLQLKIEKLKEENASLKAELRGLDSDFFNEIEDLKFGLNQAQELNRRYERCLQHLCARHGIPIDAWQIKLQPHAA